MKIQDVLQALGGRPDLIAVRPTGAMMRMSNRGALQDVRNGKPRHWYPLRADLETDDWQVRTIAQLQKEAAEFAGQAAAIEAAEQGG